jgi:hypothetical protein
MNYEIRIKQSDLINNDTSLVEHNLGNLPEEIYCDSFMKMNVKWSYNGEYFCRSEFFVSYILYKGSGENTRSCHAYLLLIRISSITYLPHLQLELKQKCIVVSKKWLIL